MSGIFVTKRSTSAFGAARERICYLRSPEHMLREYVKWDSPSLGRPMEMLWFGHSGRPMIWFPTSGGRFFENEDFGLVGAVGDHLEAGRLQIACVDSVDTESF